MTATSALIHSHFDAKTLENDLAIITLPQNQLINLEIVKPIPIGRKVVQLKDEGTVTSFGFESDAANTISENLMVARQIVIDNKACAAAFNRPVHANQFCGQDPKVIAAPIDDGEGKNSGDDGNSSEDGKEPDDSNADEPPVDNDDWTNGWMHSMDRVAADGKNQTAVCRGDTGSAIVRTTKEGVVGLGIVSRVPQGCNADRPALYTHLPAFTQWLEDATLGEVAIVDY